MYCSVICTCCFFQQLLICMVLCVLLLLYEYLYYGNCLGIRSIALCTFSMTLCHTSSLTCFLCCLILLQPEEGVAESLDYNSEETREHLLETRGYLPSAYSIENLDPINEVDNSVEVFHPHEPISLQNDILINKLLFDQAMSDGMVQVPADVEVLSPDNRDIYATDVEEFVPNNKYSYESLPYESLQFRPWSEKLMSLT